MDTTTIKQEIDTNITTNMVGAITGAILNTTLKDIVDALNEGMPTAPTINGVTLQGNLTSEDIKVGAVQTTHSSLLALRNGGNLVAGTWYRIADYQCTTAQAGTQATSHQFDILVRADDESHLNENAFAMHHDEDTYFSDSKLEAWQLKYCIDNDTDRFAFADSTNGKGVIYWMRDEWNNECPYDFKNIQFAIDNANYYTFDALVDSVHHDLSVEQSGVRCYGNVIGEYYNSNILTLNGIVFKNTSLSSGCHSNTFGDGCCYNTFGDSCYNNTFGGGCCYNIFWDGCYSNALGNYCQSNAFRNYCYSNTFGDNCQSNAFRNYCYYNTFGSNCGSNIFGDNCQHNTFGNRCYSNTFGDYIQWCTIFDGVGYCNVTGSIYPLRVQYCQILNGTQGTGDSNKLTITFATGKTYPQFAGKNSSNVLKVWAPADNA